MSHAIPPRPGDTTAEAERAQIELLRATSVSGRIRCAVALSTTVTALARRSIARARPQASGRERDLLFVDVHYGSDLAAALRADLARRERTGSPGA